MGLTIPILTYEENENQKAKGLRKYAQIIQVVFAQRLSDSKELSQ